MFYISVDGKQIYKPLDDLLLLFGPRLTLELGKAGSLEFDIPQVNPFYDKLNQLTTEVTVEMDDEEIFHGRVLSVQRAFNNVRHVYCEGDLSYLIDSVQKGVQYNGTTHDLFRKIIANHNARVDANKQFTVGTINIENRNIILVGQSNDNNINVGNIDYKQIAIDSIVDEWNNSFDYIQTCLIDYCGGYLRTRRADGKIYIDLLQDFGNTSIQEIELGRNLLDLTEELSVEDVFTVLIPLGDDNLTIASVNGGSDELVDRDRVARFGRIVRTHVFNNVNNPSTLLENARRFMSANSDIPRTVTVRAIDLHMINKSINPIKIGDKVTITSYVHDVNDALTCTKIEYDLERPEQNNYTFGNPRQTLTQRYREDIRLNNDAYGNSPTAASAAGRSAAATAAAAAKKADTEKDKALKDFYDTWIKQNKEEGEVSLGALYKKYIDDREYLINKVGIDLDAKTGNLNIESLHNVVDQHGHTIAENAANIKIVQTDASAAIENVITRQDHLADREAQHYAGITQKVDTLGSEVGMVAKDLNEVDDRLTSTVASVKAHTDDLESRVTTTASYLGKVDGKLVGHIAEITAWANETESAIQLKADKVYVDGQLEAAVAIIDDLTAGRTTASKLRATDILAGSISIFSEGGAVPVATLNHSHNFAILEGNNGDITISIGSGTTSIPQKQSFNIANTKYYKDNVAAVSIKSLEPDSYSSSGDYAATLEDGYVRYSNEQIVGRVRITLGNNDTKTAVVRVAGKRAFDAGKNAGAETATVRSVTIGAAGQPSKSEEDDVYYARVRVTATAEGTRADDSTYTDSSYSRNISVDVTEVYNAGKADGSGSAADDVSVISLGFDPDQDITYSASVNNYYVPIKTVLSNNKYRTTTLAVSAAQAQSSVSVTGIAYYTQSGETTVSYNANNKTLDASVQATLSNGNTGGSIRTVTIPATLAYNAGQNDVTATSIALNTAWSESSTGYIYETANKRFRVNVKADLSNGKSPANTIYIPASEAYDAGAASGDSNVTISSIALNTSWATSSTGYIYQSGYKRYQVNVRAKASNGAESTGNVYVSATDAYNAGSTDGAAGVTISSIALNTAWSTSSTGYVYQTANKRYAVNVKATASNGNSSTNTLYVPASDAYTAGETAGKTAGAAEVSISSIALNTAWSTSSSGYIYQSGYNRYQVSVRAKASNGAESTGYVYVSATDAFNAGAASVSSATVSSVTISRRSTNDYYHDGSVWRIPIKVVVAMSDGSSQKYEGSVSVQDVVNAAQSSGGASGHVEVKSASGNSAFVKLYDSNWNAIAINGSTAGRWIDAGTSYPFG